MEPLYLEGDSGPLFAVHHAPERASSNLRGVLYVPALWEEMNRARHVVAQQCRVLAENGVHALVLDLFGTGDSGGDAADGRWDLWIRDLEMGIQFLLGRGVERVTLLGLRAGCLLACDLARTGESAVDQLVFWQPVTQGRQMLTQFLRLRMAAGLAGGAPEPVKELRRRLEEGQVLEVAGYDLSPHLAVALDAAALSAEGLSVGTTVDCLEIVRSRDRGISPSMVKLLEQWRVSGMHVRACAVPGEPFWMTQELADAPELIAATTRLVCQAPGPRTRP